jgi:glycogenin glucosyltransferase
MAEQVYATLLLTDSYLPGALVLANSLRDAGATRKLAVLVTPTTVSVEVKAELANVYDYVIDVDPIRNDATPENLHLMGRPDLRSAFTKIQLWSLNQFSKIVYIDADVVALRAPEELFALEHAFSAAPDIGWPDLFNTGVMVLTPNAEDYSALLSMAAEGTSFDGADQGLLNQHFGQNYNRISFTYNVTPSAHYQYMPAYLHFKDKISLVHFIGAGKPWAQGRVTGAQDGPHTELVSKWWAVFDRHYGSKDIDSAETTTEAGKPTNIRLVKYFVRGYFKPSGSNEQIQGYQETGLPYNTTWDALRSAPPTGSGAEAANLPRHRYNMSSDLSHFVPPRYPSPPRNLWYNVPNQEAPKQIFPWEAQQPKPARIFIGDVGSAQPQQKYAELDEPATPTTAATTSEPGTPISRDELSEPNTPTMRAYGVGNDWQAFTRSNAWDDVPEINQYVSGMQTTRKQPAEAEAEVEGEHEGEEAAPPLRFRGLRVTDFPGDRPSLPVTPAPIRRNNYWGAEPQIADDESRLPTAEGVPAQAAWDPAAQLQKLANAQGEIFKRLESSRDASEGVLQPTPIRANNTIDIQTPSYSGPGPAWEKDL